MFIYEPAHLKSNSFECIFSAKYIHTIYDNRIDRKFLRIPATVLRIEQLPKPECLKIVSLHFLCVRMCELIESATRKRFEER